MSNKKKLTDFQFSVSFKKSSHHRVQALRVFVNPQNLARVQLRMLMF